LTKTASGLSSLHLACLSLEVKILQFLLSTIRNESEEEEEILEIYNEPDSLGRTALHVAAFKKMTNQSQSLVGLLLKAGCSIDIQDNRGRSPLFWYIFSFSSSLG